MVFPVVMKGCESWTIKKAECQRIDAFELWCWRRFLRVPWTAKKSNWSILKEINPEYALEQLMLKSFHGIAKSHTQPSNFTSLHFATSWTAAHQTPLSVEFPMQEYCSGLPFPSPGDFPNAGIKPMSPVSPALAGEFFIN